MKQCIKCGGSWAGAKQFDTECAHDFDEAPEPDGVIERLPHGDEEIFVAFGPQPGGDALRGPWLESEHPTREGAIAAWKVEWTKRRDEQRAEIDPCGCGCTALRIVASAAETVSAHCPRCVMYIVQLRKRAATPTLPAPDPEKQARLAAAYDEYVNAIDMKAASDFRVTDVSVVDARGNRIGAVVEHQGDLYKVRLGAGAEVKRGQLACQEGGSRAAIPPPPKFEKGQLVRSIYSGKLYGFDEYTGNGEVVDCIVVDEMGHRRQALSTALELVDVAKRE